MYIYKNLEPLKNMKLIKRGELITFSDDIGDEILFYCSVIDKKKQYFLTSSPFVSKSFVEEVKLWVKDYLRKYRIKYVYLDIALIPFADWNKYIFNVMPDGRWFTEVRL